jgi:hypothetical protein
VIVDGLGPAQPRVARIDWVPPSELGEDVALLAMCQLVGSDDLAADYNGSSSAANPTHFRVDPQAHGDGCIVIEERRVALRIVKAVPFTPDPFLRAGVDDTGAPGAVAWGGRTSDIVVVGAADADPDVTFADLADLRAGDIVMGGQDNHIYVRVFNRRAVPLELATVRLFQTTVANAAKPNEWRPLGEHQVPGIPAKGFKFTDAFVWNPDSLPDPSEGALFQAVLLIALVGTADSSKPPRMPTTRRFAASASIRAACDASAAARPPRRRSQHAGDHLDQRIDDGQVTRNAAHSRAKLPNL